MYIVLILFFLSLAGIIYMLGSKLILLKDGQITPQAENFPIEVPNLEKVKYVVIKKAKKHSYLILVESIRFSIRSSNFLKRIFRKFKFKINQLYKKYILKKKLETNPKEVSSFLKMVSSYKQKIKEIKHQINEEEKL